MKIARITSSMNKMKTQPSLSRDFTLLAFFIVFILLLTSVWVTFQAFKNYEQDTLERMQSEALRIDRGLIVQLENSAYLLESLGRQIQATGTNPEGIAQLFFSFAKSENPKRAIFSWVNKDQMITVSNNLGVLDKPIDVSDRDYVKKSIAEPWKVHIGRPIDGRLSHAWILPLSLGITDQNGTFLGSVIVALDTDALTENLSHDSKDSVMHFAITNQSFTLLTQTAEKRKFFSDHFDTKQLDKINLEETSSGEYSQASLFNSKQIYAYFERSSQYPFVIFIGMDAKQSAMGLRKIILPRLVQLCVLALFLLFVLWTVRKRLIYPVINLTQQTAGILNGEPFKAHLQNGPIEIEQMAFQIKQLADFIVERQRIEQELRAKNAELARIRDAAQVTNQVKADFFAYVGQELTEPVELILQQIETIKDQHFGPLNNSKYQTSANEIHAQASQLLGLLEDIKSISKAETGLLGLNESSVDLNFLLQKAVRIFREKQEKEIDTNLDITTTLPLIRGDELRIKQLILNILATISMQCDTRDPIRITSSIKAQELSLNFTFRSEPMGRGMRQRNSLDLALARLLIALHQGTLEMKTQADRMSVITLKFPALRVL